MRLNWLSPLPPARTDVANYAARALPALSRRAELTLWTDQTEVVLPPEVTAEVRSYRPADVPWAELNRADLSIFHIGNNQEFHGAPWLVSRRHPGVVVLHDVSVPHLFVNLYRDRLRDRDAYSAQMERFYGRQGRLFALRFWEHLIPPEYMAEHYPLTGLAVEGALGVLVHTPPSYEALRPWQRWPLAYQPLAYRPAPHRPRRADPPRPGEPYRLVLFGFISANRRLMGVLEALAAFPQRDRFRLGVYGALWDEAGVAACLRRGGLGELVTLHGFVPDEELEEALAASHLAINLRYPTMGEASGSQLKIWEHALPSLVSDVGWYATLPPTAVAFVRHAHETEDIQNHLTAFLADPGRFARMGQEGRRLLDEDHAPDTYADGLLRLCGEALRHRPRALSYYLAERAGAEMSLWSASHRAGAAVRPVAETISRLVA